MLLDIGKMKINIDLDERYPDYYFTPDGEYAYSKWGRDVEISEEEWKEHIEAHKVYHKSQIRLQELYDSARNV